MNNILLVITHRTTDLNTHTGYFIGVVLALFILAYLIYALVKPEKF
jgi:K+-transporting ATPase KdpF subunit